MRSVRVLMAVFVGASLGIVAFTWPARLAHAQTFERITSFDVDLTIGSDGTVLVRERIAYDFGSTPRHGLLRVIPVREDYPPKDHHDRIYPLHVVSVRAAEGTPARYEVGEDADNQVIRIGDPERTIVGRHTYEITYRVRGALNGFPGHDELFWDVIGGEWTVPIESAMVTLTAPVAIDKINCFSGSFGSMLPCGSEAVDGDTATFTAPSGGLSSFQSMTVTVGIPKGAVPEPAPILEERFALASAFRATPATAAVSGGLLAAIAIALGALFFLVGRDRRYRGSPVDVAFSPRAAALPASRSGTEPVSSEQRVPLAGGDETPVEFVPPAGLRPGQVGTLVDFTANPLDVTATIVDLAVRGYLTIEETREKSLFRAGDWKLTETEKEQVSDHGELLEYERTLMKGLFREGPAVQLSELHNTFATRMASVQAALMDDAIQRKWFAGKPGTMRALWAFLGIAAVVVGVVLTVVLATFTHAALIGVPVIIGGFVLAVGSKWMPHRTAKGYAALRRVDGFRRFIDESERERARFAERTNLFSEYLPYAVVFGATKKWAKAFEGLGGEPPDTASWYVGQHAFTYAAFSGAIDGFSVSTAGTLTSSPSTSGSSGFASGGGFSGGGGGGGGGGSW